MLDLLWHWDLYLPLVMFGLFFFLLTINIESFVRKKNKFGSPYRTFIIGDHEPTIEMTRTTSSKFYVHTNYLFVYYGCYCYHIFSLLKMLCVTRITHTVIRSTRAAYRLPCTLTRKRKQPQSQPQQTVDWRKRKKNKLLWARTKKSVSYSCNCCAS